MPQYTQPLSREERRALADKEAVEKSRLAQRRECFQRYQDPGVIGRPEEGTPAFLSDSERFDRDVVSAERARRANERDVHDQFIDARRSAADRREDHRRATDEERKRAEQAHIESLRLPGRPNKNASGEQAYDIITGEYLSGDAAARAKYDDDVARWRADARAAHLDRHLNSVDYDPVSHLPRRRADLPPPPAKPAGDL
jgi:hypothetical protein